MDRSKRFIWGTAVAAWFVAVGGVMGAMHAYSARPGVGERALEAWPHGTSLGLDRSRPTVVLFVHPRCPCTRATIENLRSVWPDGGVDGADGGGASLTIVSSGPAAGGALSEEVEGWLASLPKGAGARVVVDASGEEARRFGATTSGHVIVADASGAVRFCGGVTPGRGHVGRCDALDRFAGALEATSLARSDGANPPVFGCPIFGKGICKTNGADAEAAKGGSCCGHLPSTTP